MLEAGCALSSARTAPAPHSGSWPGVGLYKALPVSQALGWDLVLVITLCGKAQCLPSTCEDQRGQVTCPGAHSQCIAELLGDPGLTDPKAYADNPDAMSLR